MQLQQELEQYSKAAAEETKVTPPHVGIDGRPTCVCPRCIGAPEQAAAQNEGSGRDISSGWCAGVALAEDDGFQVLPLEVIDQITAQK